MDVSVIFATYNRSDVLEAVLEAWRNVQAVTRYEFEIICSDDASTDNTVEILKKATDLPITIIENPKGGAGPARNAALQIAKGKIVIFTGDDMFPCPQFVNRHYENYLKFGSNVATLGRIDWHKDITLNHLMYHITDIGCEQFGFIGLPAYQLIDFRHFYTSNISVSREILDKTGVFFRTDFDKYGFEDIEFGYRLQKNGMKIYYDPSIVIEHHHLYPSVEKFCIRQETAGEELVVFNDMHSDLQDKCICDVNNLKQAFTLFRSNCHHGWSVTGFFIYSFLYIARKFTHFIEWVHKKHSFAGLNKLCSLIYAGLFQFYFFYGCTTRIAEGTHSGRSLITEFTFKYLKKSFAQIYWDTGYGFNEMESRKWCIWDKGYVSLDIDILDNVREIRLSPLKTKCIAWIKEVSFITETGEKKAAHLCWYNCKDHDQLKYDFTNTIDPQLVFNEILPGYRKMHVEMSVKNMQNLNLLRRIRRSMGIVYHKLRAKQNMPKKVNVDYAYGQPRRIQIALDTTVDTEYRERLIHEYQNAVAILGDAVVIAPISHLERGYCNYIYNPASDALDKAQMLQVAYALLDYNYDYILVSKTYDFFPNIGGKCIDDLFVYSDLLKGTSISAKVEHSVGRYMRLPSYDQETETMNVVNVFKNVELIDQHYLCTTRIKWPEQLISKRNFSYTKKKPMVFVMPVFLAMGGVERNTIETMRSLQNDYDFCMITMELHQPEQGSLHYQLKRLCNYIFDLNEIMGFSDYLTALYELKEIFHPDVVWLCNNFPWLEEHFSEFRKLFEDSRIVAQDVYDTQVGWIEYYDTAPIRTCDRFIAITELIKDTFMNKYSIPEEKIDVIYPVVDSKHVLEEKSSSLTRQDICAKYGLNADKKIFSTVGRIAEQKNPLRYLRLVEQIADDYPEAQFVMVGEGALDNTVDEYIKDHRLEGKIVRVPYISNAPELIRVLSGLMILSNYEGMPIVSIEAMSFGVPVFSTDVGDLKRFLVKHKNGLIIDETLTDADNFKYFYQNLSEYQNYALQSADEILNFFSADYQAEQYRKCFGNL